jgi:predicted thioesterase
VAEGFHLTEVWASDLATDAMVNVMDGAAIEAINEQLKRLLDLRAALVGSEADTTDTQPTDQEDQS